MVVSFISAWRKRCERYFTGDNADVFVRDEKVMVETRQPHKTLFGFYPRGLMFQLVALESNAKKLLRQNQLTIMA